MELTQAYKHKNKAKATVVSVCTFSRLYALGFIAANRVVFDGLVRAATPFGGNCLPVNKAY
ncbi:hypothetical protein DYU11_15645 [Fibrisoma montanum]|uniref:Uncharacterized protein n=1 Tax=Fibrisoma montanum TaxID=2305895 RepID=A0A418M8N6_9BACT|nr:hypothetical protein DYU11_15645 [Fibrisoma montanum]